MDVKGKAAIVTGGGSGIGRATAERLAREGASVVVADLNEADARETVDRITTAGGRALFFRADTSDGSAMQKLIQFAEAQLGGLDIIHNNAGITAGYRFPEIPVDRLQRVLDVNLRGVILGTYYAIPALKRRGGGVIVQTASAAGLAPWQADPIYAATKAGVVNFVRSLVFLHAEANIRVNCVCPGLVATNIGQHAREAVTPERRAEMDALRERAGALLQQAAVLQPEQVAEAVLRLITDDSLNGRAYHVAAQREWQLV